MLAKNGRVGGRLFILRHYASTTRETWSPELLRPSASKVAKALSATKVWGKTGTGDGNSSRVNIASERLCNGIEKYFAPSLERHVGCDLVDLFPGAGVWSSRLHKMVRPRSHVLMEPDEKLYRPFLAKLLDRPGARLVPHSGMVWSNLDDVLGSLGHSTTAQMAQPTRNDSLLVTANLAAFPRTRAAAQLTRLYLYQLISAIRTGELFQRYGLVRMLVWARPVDIRSSILPTTAQRRTNVAVEAEMACEWVHEVAGADVLQMPTKGAMSGRLGGPREEWVELLSTRRALKRLAATGVRIPSQRESSIARRVLTGGRKLDAGLDQLDTLIRSGRTPDDQQLSSIRGVCGKRLELGARWPWEMLDEYNGLVQRRRLGQDTKAEEEKWAERVSSMSYIRRSVFGQLRDNLHLFAQDPPGLFWDRRKLEPLKVWQSDFFPAVPLSLVDIQPKAVDAAAARCGPEGDGLLDLVLGVLFRSASLPISHQLDELWPDAASWILPRCPSLRDLHRGGTLNGNLPVRVLNETQFTEILTAWQKWPFRPTAAQLERLHSEAEDDEDHFSGEANHLL